MKTKDMCQLEIYHNQIIQTYRHESNNLSYLLFMKLIDTKQNIRNKDGSGRGIVEISAFVFFIRLY